MWTIIVLFSATPTVRHTSRHYNCPYLSIPALCPGETRPGDDNRSSLDEAEAKTMGIDVRPRTAEIPAVGRVPVKGSVSLSQGGYDHYRRGARAGPKFSNKHDT